MTRFEYQPAYKVEQTDVWKAWLDGLGPQTEATIFVFYWNEPRTTILAAANVETLYNYFGRINGISAVNTEAYFTLLEEITNAFTKNTRDRLPSEAITTIVPRLTIRDQPACKPHLEKLGYELGTGIFTNGDENKWYVYTVKPAALESVAAAFPAKTADPWEVQN